MPDSITTILIIIATFGGFVTLLIGYAFIRTMPEARRLKAFAQEAAKRKKLADSEFFARAHLQENDRQFVRAIRTGLGREAQIDSDFVYPEDDICSYGFQYDDSVSAFVFGCGVITKDPYWFPMEVGSSIGDIFPWIRQINSEQVGAGDAEEAV
jgi:hypothetical protein